MKLETIRQVNQRYLDRLKELVKLESKEVSNHFRHITGTPSVGIVGYSDLIEIDSWQNLRKKYNKNRRLLRDYLRLIDKFEDFREKELTISDGYFPNIRDEGPNGAENYITEAKKRLSK